MQPRRIASALQHTLTAHSRTPADTLAHFLSFDSKLDGNAYMWERVQQVRNRFPHPMDRIVHCVDVVEAC